MNKPLRYIFISAVLLLLFTGCRKSYSYNAGRNKAIGNYHYTFINHANGDTLRYDIRIAVPSPDQGNNICIPYDGANSVCSSFYFSDTINFSAGGTKATGLNGSYRDDSLFIENINMSFPGHIEGYDLGVKF